MDNDIMTKWLFGGMAFLMFVLGVFLLVSTYRAIFQPELFYAN